MNHDHLATGAPSSREGCPGPRDLAASYRVCRAICQNSGSNFTAAFRLLPPAQRAGMHALYAFMRLTDDLSDEPGDADTQHAKLQAWESDLRRTLSGDYSHPIHPALHHTIEHFQVDPTYLFDVLSGVVADMHPVQPETFAELYPYCYKVASAVGLACLPIWGVQGNAYHAPAEAAGIAFQLTNILRDLQEDLGRNRVYLPREDLARFDCPPERWQANAPEFQAMMRFQVERAREYYRQSEPLAGMLPRPGRAIFHMMASTYRSLLEEIPLHGYDVLSRRLRVSRRRKLTHFARAWLIRIGVA